MNRTKLILLTSFLFVSTVGIFIACNKNKPSANKEATSVDAKGLQTVISGVVGYIDEEENFQEPNHALLVSFFQHIFDIPVEVEFNPYTIHSVPGDPGQPDILYVYLRSTDGTVSVTSSLDDLGGGNYLMDGEKSCECKTIDCATTYGCDATQTTSGCICSTCEGECEKKSTASSTGYVQNYFITNASSY